MNSLKAIHIVVYKNSSFCEYIAIFPYKNVAFKHNF